MKYKMIFLDIDGTLTNSKKEITPKTKAALIKAQEMGIIAAIASGRPDKGVSKYIKELELVAYDPKDVERLIKFMVQGE